MQKPLTPGRGATRNDSHSYVQLPKMRLNASDVMAIHAVIVDAKT